MPKPPTTVRAIRLPLDLYLWLKRWAAKENRSFSGQVVTILMEFRERMEGKNDNR